MKHKLRNFIIFIYIFIQCCFQTIQPSGIFQVDEHNQLRVSQCFNDSFQIVLKSTTYKERTITFVLRVAKTSVVPNYDSGTLRDYINLCLENLLFVYRNLRTSNVETFKRKIEITENVDNIVTDFEDLEPITGYQFEIGYEAISPVSHSKYFINQTSQTCFGAPNPPRDFLRTLHEDGSVTISWKDPLVINAPDVCYYLITLQRVSNAVIVNTTEQRETFSK